MKSELVASFSGKSKRTGKFTFAFYLLAFLIIASPGFSQQVSSADLRTIHVKFKEEFRPKISPSGRSASSGIAKMDKISKKHKALSIQRIFPDAGIYEAAHKAYGLHLWYEIKFSKEVSLAQAITDYKNLDYFHSVEECKEYKADWEENNDSAPELPLGTNDPLFTNQWHFANLGQTGGKHGADINLLKAWQIETGSPNVIVAVIDGGIHQGHPDLAGAMWTNADEIPGNKVDDDHNGYVDDIHGYGFGDKSSIIGRSDHATHVAGTIGAISNNGVGVSGIAGGSGVGNGVRLMSCAAFGTFENGGFEEAMVYAADNGAVISQNSWGGGSTAIEAAIDYFVNRAGYDNSAARFNSNIQTGPMAGGLVIFAAGNDNTDDIRYGYPASYASVIAVASTDHNDVKSPFSNFGRWVDIAAPGSNVYSTVPSTSYRSISGTSMACPHVSGAAALVISNLQHKGLKASEVWDRLRLSAHPIDAENPTMNRKLGAGRLDAFASLLEPDLIPPAEITDLRATELHYSSITLLWTAAGASGNVGQGADYDIRYSTSPITAANFGGATRVSNPPLPPPYGEQVTFELNDLSPATTYYIALKSSDIFRNISGISNILNVTTLRPPMPDVITTQLSEQLYSGGISSRQLLVRNTGNDDLLIRLGVPDIAPAPVGLQSGEKGRLFAINRQANKIDELNPKSGAVIASVPLPEYSTVAETNGLAFDGKYLYYGSGPKVYKINPENGVVLSSFTIDYLLGIDGMAWSGRYLYVADRLTNSTYEVDSDDGSIVRRLTFGATGLTFAGSRGTLFIAAGGIISEVSIATGEVIRQFSPTLTGNITGLGFSNIENVIFISDGSSNIHAIDPDTGGVRYNIPYLGTTGLASDEYKRGWLETDGQPVTIVPGATVSLLVTFIATDLPAGQWVGSLKVIPINVNIVIPVVVPVDLKVIGGSDIETASNLNLGAQFVGFPIDSTIFIKNRGSSDLVIRDIRSSDTRVTHSLSNVTLTPGEKVEMTVTITPIAAGIIDASLTFSSDDPDEGLLSIPVHAEIFLPPAIEVNPTALSTTLSTGQNTTLNFTAKNTGASVLHWKAGYEGMGLLTIKPSSIDQTADANQSAVIKPLYVEEFTLKAESPERLTCLSHDPQSELIYAKSLLGTTFYRYDPVVDRWSVVGSTPESLIGQAAYLDGKIYHGGSQLGVYTIQTNSWTSVPFPFAGTTGNLTSDGQYVYVVSDATLHRYDPIANTWLQLASLPRSIGGPYGGLSFHNGALFAHEDGTGDYGGHSLFYKYYIATDTWQENLDIRVEASSGSAIDPAGGKYFVVNGLQMYIVDLNEGGWTKAENPFSVGGLSGLVFVGNEGSSGVYIIQGDGTGFCRYETAPLKDLVSVTPTVGDLLPGATQTFNVSVNAADLDAGTFSKNIRVFSDHPTIESIVPVTVTVIGVPDIFISPATVDVGEIHLGVSRSFPLKVKNTGTAPLSVSSITVDRADFSVSTPSFIVQTGESIEVVVSFTPITAGPQTGTFKFFSNDPDEATLDFVLKGIGVFPPIPGITPGVISATLFTGAKSLKQLEISNTGGGTMDYAIDFIPSWDWMKGNVYGYLPKGETRKVDITIDASGKPTGTYVGKVRLWVHADLVAEVPVTMIVTGAPDISTSKQTITFGDQFVDNQYDSIISIKNDGVFPLSITSISSNNTAFSISPTAPINLAPGESTSATIRFIPTTLSHQNGNITLTTNDPDELTYVIPVSGNGIDPPILTTSQTQLTATASTNESLTQTLTLTNSGGSVLKWQIVEQFGPQPSSVNDGNLGEPMAAGDFKLLSPSTTKLTSLVVNPSSGQIYALDPGWQSLLSYNFYQDTWDALTEIPDFRAFGMGGSVFLNSKMYCVHANNAATIHIYTPSIKYWSTIPNGLGIGTATITADGTLLYLAGGGKFKSFNPKTKIWTDLPIPTITLDGVGGLNYFDGAIYAHEGNGNGFAKYTIATRTWENLVPVPGDAALGSTIDPIRKRYYAYGKNYGSSLYEYDIASGLWNVLTIPLFNVGDGGIVHTQSSGSEGIYFLQGTPGNGFGRYEPRAEIPWLRASDLTGEIPASESQSMGINFNAYGLSPGVYNGLIKVTSNDPEHERVDIPVQFNIKGPPKIELPEQVGGMVDGFGGLHSFQMRIQNTGQEILKWNFANPLPSMLTANKLGGAISNESFDDIQMTFDPTELTPGIHAYVLEIVSNDMTNKKVWTTVQFSVIKNHAPIVVAPIATQSLKAKQIEISLENTFSDPDNDALSYSTSSDNREVAWAYVTDNTLFLVPVSSGVATVSVTANDIWNLAVSTSFDVNVTQVVAVEEFESDASLLAIPNPFKNEVSLRYQVEDPGRAAVVIYDVSGKIVWQVNEFSEVRGRNEIVLNGSPLAPGIYSCRLTRNGDEVRTIRLVRH